MQTQRTDLRTQQGKERVKQIEEVALNTYITMCKIDSQWEATVQHKELNPVLWDNLEEWEEDSKGGDICTLTADSHCCTAETNKAL